MGLNRDLVGKDYGTKTYEVTAEAIERYARATNDLNDRYLAGPDSVATPVFPVVPAFESFMAAAMDPDLGADLLRLVHGAEEHALYTPIRPGDTLTVRSDLESVEAKETGETFTVRATETNQDGELAAEVRGTMFIRGTAARLRPSPEQQEPGEVVYEETTKVDEDQPRRYAEASGDRNPIHLDEDVARSAGLPGVIVHGMCTMAIAGKAAVDGVAGGDPTRIKRLAVRFSRPVLPGQELTTRLWRAGDGLYGFETYNPRGSAVIRNGEAEVAR